MRMTRFRVQNYKKVQDSGWVSCNELTVFVGKNESGKSALFRGLSKLNPSDGEKYDGLKEFPRRRYTAEFELQDYPVATVEYQLNKDELKELQKICPTFENVTTVCCTRYYSSRMDVKFRPKFDLPDISNKAFSDLLEKLLSDIQSLKGPYGTGDELGGIKTTLSDMLTQMRDSLVDLEKQVNQQQVATILSTFSTQSNESWQQEILGPFILKLQEFKENTQLLVKIDEAKQWIEKNIPRFIYFDRYDVIDSAVHIINFAQQIRDDSSAPRVRATKCLFEHVGLDLENIKNLDPAREGEPEDRLRKLADERAVKMSSASTAMTTKFSDWWEQRKHKFHYQVDGPFFRIWVSDDLDPSEIELDQRSLGLQYFFSFYVVFLVEARGEHSNSILLLDEPGLHMHGTAQAKLCKFLEKLSKENQILYTTHAPFMIDGDHLERVRVVYEKRDGTTEISDDVWPKDKDALFPLQAALGYSIAQTLFYAKRQVIVEGPTDYGIYKAINEIIREKGMEGLRADLILVPVGGVSKLMPLASMLVGHDVEIAAILDGDEPGRRAGKKLQDKLLSDKGGRCVFIGDYCDNQNAELEDLLPEDLYLSAVEKSYGFKLNFTKDEKKIQKITERVSMAFERLNKGNFEKWRPARVLIDWLNNDKDKFPQETLETFSQIFQAANNLFIPGDDEKLDS
jgi:predicted ATP-dependent endonuclease of OLD family